LGGGDGKGVGYPSHQAQTRLELWGHGMGGATIGPEEDMTPHFQTQGEGQGDIIWE